MYGKMLRTRNLFNKLLTRPVSCGIFDIPLFMGSFFMAFFNDSMSVKNGVLIKRKKRKEEGNRTKKCANKFTQEVPK